MFSIKRKTNSQDSPLGLDLFYASKQYFMRQQQCQVVVETSVSVEPALRLGLQL